MLFLTIKTRTRLLLSNFVKILSWHRIENESSRVSGIEKCLSNDSSVAAKAFNFGAGYTAEDKNLILQTINACTMDELKKYSMTEARIKKLIAHRDKNECFDTLEQVLLLPGIEIGVLDKFCKSIVKKDSGPKFRGLGGKSDLLTPLLDQHRRIAIDTCAGIWVCGNLISWARLDKNCNLLQWDCQSLEDVAMKDGLVAVVDSVARVVSKVPLSDAYIMESDPIIPFARINSTAYYLQLQRQQIVATIASILGTREHRVDGDNDDRSDIMIKNVYMMRSRTPARLFNLLIGSEIVSAENVVEKMIEERHVAKDEVTIPVRAHPDIKEYYKSRDIYQREQMNWALLLTSAFVNLSIMRTESLNKKSLVKNAERNRS